MAKNESCCSEAVRLVLACSGASNVGQVSNEVAKRLGREEAARFFCLAGVGGQLSGIVATVKGASKVLVIDGCPVGCGRKCMEQAGLTRFEHLLITEQGIEKKHDLDLDPAEVGRATDAARQKLAASQEG